MGLHYLQQLRQALIGTKNPTSFEITTATLTSAYTGNNKIIPIDYAPEVMIYCQYTPGSGGGGNYVTIKLEFSHDGINHAQDIVELHTIGTTNIYLQEKKFGHNGASVALTTYTFRVPVRVADKYMKFSVKETKVGGSDGVFWAEALISGK